MRCRHFNLEKSSHQLKHGLQFLQVIFHELLNQFSLFLVYVFVVKQFRVVHHHGGHVVTRKVVERAFEVDIVKADENSLSVC